MAEALIDGYTGLARTLSAQGRPDEALAAVAELRQHVIERGMFALTPVVDSLHQHILLENDPQAALAAHVQARRFRCPLSSGSSRR